MTHDPRLFTRGPPEPLDVTYLGDGVYAAHDGYQVWLSLQTGDTIALDYSVMSNLLEYQRKIRK